MPFLFLVWLLFGVLSFGPAAFIFGYMNMKSKKPWPTRVDNGYKPRISIILPTYNESSIVLLKLANLSRLSYPKDLMETVVVDSNSSDDTVEIVRQFSVKESQLNIKLLVEKERKGKSHALNYALDHCSGDVIIVSDADCFWPSDILEKSLPFLADPTIGAIGGPKFLLNSSQTWVTRTEESYLRSANNLRLGESKAGSTLFFEGGFSAFKKHAFDRFDPYKTGSDDCGTLVNVIAKNFRAINVPQAAFYSTFPGSFRGKLSIKLRRTNQLVRIFAKYANLFFKGRVKATKSTVLPNILLYLFSPIAFVGFMFMSLFFVLDFPLLLAIFAFLIVPKVRFYFYEVFESNILLLTAIIGVAVGKGFSIWSKPEDRMWLTKDALSKLNLI